MNPSEYLSSIGACRDAREWVEAQDTQDPGALWARCPRGDWMLWLLEKSGVDCSELGYACAERARQSALRALPAGLARDRLAVCEPIRDSGTASSAAAAAAARAAAWTAADAADAAERQTIADLVRAKHPSPPIAGFEPATP